MVYKNSTNSRRPIFTELVKEVLLLPTIDKQTRRFYTESMQTHIISKDYSNLFKPNYYYAKILPMFNKSGKDYPLNFTRRRYTPIRTLKRSSLIKI